MLCDPWLSSGGAYLQSWHQFPPNRTVDRARLDQADFLYLSSDRPDHFDPELLADFPTDRVTVVIADFASDALRRRLSQLGFSRIIRGADWEQIPLGPGFSVRIVRDPSLYRTDSFLLAAAGEWTILNQGACHIPEGLFAYLSLQRIDLLVAGLGVPGWYPYVYGHEPSRERELVEAADADALDDLVRLVRDTKARHVFLPVYEPVLVEVPTAGGLGPRDHRDLAEAIGQETPADACLVGPGAIARLTEPSEVPVVHTWEPDPDPVSTLAEYRVERAPGISSSLARLATLDASLIERFAQHVERQFAASPYIRDRVEAIVEFRLVPASGGNPPRAAQSGGASIWLEARPGAHVVSRRPPGAANYRFILPVGVAGLLAEGAETWDAVLLSRRLAVRCAPDRYNWPLFALLRYGHDRNLLYLVERALRKGEFDTTVVEDAGQRYRIQRYCPHAGEDLTFGRLTDGKLVCPGHGWTFDLRNGGACIRGGNLRLRVEIDP